MADECATETAAEKKFAKLKTGEFKNKISLTLECLKHGMVDVAVGVAEYLKQVTQIN